MPKVKIPGGGFKESTWDPVVVADLIYRGFTVHADKGTDPSTFAVHQQQLDARLRKLWGEKNLHAEGGRSTMTFDSRKEQTPGDMVSPPAGSKSDFINIQPNPYTHFTIENVDPRPSKNEEQDIFQNRKKKPWET